MPDTNPQAIIYCRLAYQNDIAMERQEALLRTLAHKHGYPEAKVFVDNGYSGMNLDRPAFRQMEEAVRANESSVLFILDESRISRDYLSYLQWKREMNSHGLQIISLQDGVL